MLRFLVYLVLTPTMAQAQGSNVVMTTTGVAVASQGSRGGLLVRQGEEGQIVSEFPSGITSFDDVSIDPINEDLVFALSTSARQVCSYSRAQTALTLVNCVGSSFAVSPFSGVSSYGGTLMISGGTGGFTVYDYDTASGMLESAARIQNLDLGVIGHPDVLMLDADIAALSTDFDGGDARFGTAIVGLTQDPSILHDFRVPVSLGFEFSLGPTNFPLVNALYNNSFMYTANGPVTVQDPFVEGSSNTIEDLPEFFSALTVAVNNEKQKLVVGGIDNDDLSEILVLDISDNPTSPTAEQIIVVDGRITSVASGANHIAWTTATGSSIQVLHLEGESSMPPMPEMTEPPSVVTSESQTASVRNGACGLVAGLLLWLVC